MNPTNKLEMEVVNRPKDPLSGREYLPYFDADPFEEQLYSGPDLARDIKKVLDLTREYSFSDDLAAVDEAVRVLRMEGLFNEAGNIVKPERMVGDFVLRNRRDPIMGAGYIFGPRSIAERTFVPSAVSASAWANPDRCIIPAVVGVVNFDNFLERLERAGHIVGRPRLAPADLAHLFSEKRISIFTPRHWTDSD